MARPQTKINKEEVDEIITLKLQELGGMKSKLTYNNVWNFNKKLCKENTKRKNGEKFNLYGYTFWASEYNNKPYYGKKKIDEIKSSNSITLAGECFDIETDDILLYSMQRP